MISHPDFVHIPLPTELPCERVPRKRGRPSPSSSKLNNLLHNDAIPLLQKRGLVAESLSVNSISWQGIVRLPDMAGSLASSAERIAAIKEISGQYRIMHITCVPSHNGWFPIIIADWITNLGLSLINLEGLVYFL